MIANYNLFDIFESKVLTSLQNDVGSIVPAVLICKWILFKSFIMAKCVTSEVSHLALSSELKASFSFSD